MNQQAEPSADSVPTQAELRHVVNALRSSCGSRQARKPPCISVCSVLVTTSTNSARTNRLGPLSDWLASLMNTVVNANRKPAPSPASAAGCTVAASSSRGFMPRPASDSVITPDRPMQMPTQASGRSTSPSTISATIALCTVSVLE